MSAFDETIMQTSCRELVRKGLCGRHRQERLLCGDVDGRRGEDVCG